MIINVPIWRNADLVRIIPITRGDLNQAIARCGFRPEYKPKPGKDRWYSWRDVVAVAAAQDLRKIGFGPAIAFGLVQSHLSPFLRDAIKTPDDCDGVIWLVSLRGDHLAEDTSCEFLRQGEGVEALIAPSENARIVVNIGRIAERVRNDLQATETAKVIREEFQITGPIM
jgi:hypothetical protein